MKGWRAWVTVPAVFVTAVTVLAGSGASASNDPLRNRKNSVDGQIDQVRETLEGASKDVVAAAVAVRTAQLRLSAARTASKAANHALAVAVAHDQDVAARLAVAQAEQAKAERQVAAGLAAQEQTRQQIGRMARETYMDAGLSGLAVALGADTPEAFTDRIALSGVALRSRGDALDELAVQQADLRATTSKVQAVAAEVTVLERQAAAAVAARRNAQAAAVAAQARIARVLSAEQAALKVARSKASAERSRLDALQREQTKLQAMLAARARAERVRRRLVGRRVRAGPLVGLPLLPGLRADHLGLRPAVPPDPAHLAAPQRHRLRRRVRDAGARGGVRGDHQRRLGRWVRQPHRHRPRAGARRRARHHLQPPHEDRRERARRTGSADRVLGDHRALHRVSPALRDAGQRQLRQSAGVGLT
jgi:hypothetical protein